MVAESEEAAPLEIDVMFTICRHLEKGSNLISFQNMTINLDVKLSAVILENK